MIQTRRNPSAAQPAANDSLLRRGSLVILLALIPLRSIVSETPTFEVHRMMRAMEGPLGAQPATTFCISAIIILIGSLVLAEALLRGRRLLPTGAGLGAAILAVAAVISTLHAGQRHLALCGTIEFISLVIYFWTLRQLLIQPALVRVALYVCIATGLTLAIKCASQYFYEFSETINQYEEMQRQRAAAGDNHPPSGLEHDFRMRLLSQAVHGFYGHPNLLASQLILFFMAGIALMADRRARNAPRPTLIAPAAMLLGGAIAMYGTQSKGAMAALVLSLAIWIILHVISRFASARPTQTVAAGWLLAFGCATGLALFLHARPDALGRSIHFRTMYWRGAWDMIMAQGPLGVGAHNFGRHFTQYKPVECPEEVESPHSWPVQLAAEWGAAGLAGFIILAIGVSLIATRRADALHPAHTMGAAKDQQQSILLWTAAVFSVAFFPWLAIYVDPLLLLMSLGVTVLPWLAVMLGACIESRDARDVTNVPFSPSTAAAIAAGLIGFLIHTSIDLALLTPGPATTFFALAAILLATRDNQRSPETTPAPMATAPPSRRPLAAACAVIGSISALTIIFWLARPSAILTRSLQVGRLQSRPSPWDAYSMTPAGRAYQRGHAIYPLDATAAIELLEEWIPRVTHIDHANMGLSLAAEAARRDPRNSVIDTHRSQLFRQRFEMTQNRNDFLEAIRAYRAVVAAYPTAPYRHVNMANFLEEYAQRFGDPDASREAAEHLRTALALEEKRIYVSLPNRMPPEVADALRQRLAALEATARPASQPAAP